MKKLTVSMILFVLFAAVLGVLPSFAADASSIAPWPELVYMDQDNDTLHIGLVVTSEDSSNGSVLRYFKYADGRENSSFVSDNIEQYGSFENDSSHVFLLVDESCGEDLKPLAYDSLTGSLTEQDIIHYQGEEYPLQTEEDLAAFQEALFAGADGAPSLESQTTDIYNASLEFGGSEYTRQYCVILAGEDLDTLSATLLETGHWLPLYFVASTNAKDNIEALLPEDSQDISQIFFPATQDGWESVSFGIEQLGDPIDVPEQESENDADTGDMHLTGSSTVVIIAVSVVLLAGIGVAVVICAVNAGKKKDSGASVVIENTAPDWMDRTSPTGSRGYPIVPENGTSVPAERRPGAAARRFPASGEKQDGSRAAAPASQGVLEITSPNAPSRGAETPAGVRRTGVPVRVRRAPGSRAVPGTAPERDQSPLVMHFELSSENFSSRTCDVTIKPGANISIGRSQECEICVPDRRLSRVHVTITNVDGRPILNDLGSTNGTVYNGAQLKGPVVLRVNDTIHVGLTKLKIAGINRVQV